eukprot:1631729-Pleurochrysis_carterae.AAC.2
MWRRERGWSFEACSRVGFSSQSLPMRARASPAATYAVGQVRASAIHSCAAEASTITSQQLAEAHCVGMTAPSRRMPRPRAIACVNIDRAAQIDGVRRHLA